MSDRIDINDIQMFFRHTNVEDYLKSNAEKAACKKYRETYHKLLDANYKRNAYLDLYRNIRFTHHSQQTIDNVKEIVLLDKEINMLESQLEDMEQSKLFQKIHHRALYGEKKAKTSMPLLIIKHSIILIVCFVFFIASGVYTEWDFDTASGAIDLILMLIAAIFGIISMVKLIKAIILEHKASIRYKEKFYKKINRIHTFYENGAITEEEFNNFKQEILNKLN